MKNILQAFAVLNLLLWVLSLGGMVFMWGDHVIANSLPHLVTNVFLGGLIFTFINLMACMIISIATSSE